MANIWEDPSAYGYNKNLAPNPLGGGSINGYDTYVPGGGARSAPSGDTGRGTGVYMNGKEISIAEVGDFLKNNPMNSVDDMSRAMNSGQLAGLSSVDMSNLRSYARENFGFNPNYGVGAQYNPNAGTLGSGGDSGGPTNTASGSAGGSSGSYNLGMGGGSSSGNMFGDQSGGGQNAYLSQMADDIARRSDKSLGTSLASIRGNSIGVGGLGGSRQGVAEGVAIGNSQDSLQGNLANLFGTDWNNSQNRNLQYYGVNTNAALTNQGQMQNFYTNNRQLDQSGQRLGADLYQMGNQGYLNQGQGVYQIGQTEQNAPWQVQTNANNIINPYTGSSGTTTTTGNSGGGTNAMVGGALSGMQIGKNLGLGSGSGSGTPSGWENYSTGQANYLGNYYS